RWSWRVATSGVFSDRWTSVRRTSVAPLRPPAMMATDRPTIQWRTGGGGGNLHSATKKLVRPDCLVGMIASPIAARRGSCTEQSTVEATEGMRSSAIEQHRLRTLPMAVTVAEPFTEKLVELEFLVRLQHLLVGIGIDTLEAAAIMHHSHFGHAGIVVQAYLHARRRQPLMAFLMSESQPGGVRAALKYLHHQTLLFAASAEQDMTFVLQRHVRHQLAQT